MNTSSPCKFLLMVAAALLFVIIISVASSNGIFALKSIEIKPEAFNQIAQPLRDFQEINSSDQVR